MLFKSTKISKVTFPEILYYSRRWVIMTLNYQQCPGLKSCTDDPYFLKVIILINPKPVIQRPKLEFWLLWLWTSQVNFFQIKFFYVKMKLSIHLLWGYYRDEVKQNMHKA